MNTNPNPYIHLLQVGWEKCKPKYTYTEYRNMYLIHFIKSGKGTITKDKKVYQQKPNDIILTRPNQITILSADENDPWEYFWFAFNGTFAGELVERTVFKNGCFQYEMPDSSICDLIVNSIIRLENTSSQDIYGLIILFKLLEFLIDFADKSHESEKSNTKKNYLDYVYKSQEYIYLNYYKPIHTSDISKMLNIDRSHFYRVFKAHTGLSPEEFLINFRIQKAKQFLSETQLPIATVAQSVGYNYSSFYPIFCKESNMTPSQYRRAYRKKINNQQDEEKPL